MRLVHGPAGRVHVDGCFGDGEPSPHLRREPRGAKQQGVGGLVALNLSLGLGFSVWGLG